MPVERPNILLIWADELRADGLACFGNPLVKTPNLDRLAASGTRFTQCMVTQPTCTPCRASLLTGCFPSALLVSRSASSVHRSGAVRKHVRAGRHARTTSGDHRVGGSAGHRHRCLQGKELRCYPARRQTVRSHNRDSRPQLRDADREGLARHPRRHRGHGYITR